MLAPKSSIHLPDFHVAFVEVNLKLTSKYEVKMISAQQTVFFFATL